jgi:hypothetical protein
MFFFDKAKELLANMGKEVLVSADEEAVVCSKVRNFLDEAVVDGD